MTKDTKSHPSVGDRPIEWSYVAIQSIGAQQRHLLYFLMFLFIFELLVWRSTEQFIGLPTFGIKVPKEEILLGLPTALNLLIIAYYGALTAMRIQFDRFKKSTKFDEPLFTIDCNNTFVDFLSLSKAFTIRKMALGHFFMPVFLVSIYLVNWKLITIFLQSDKTFGTLELLSLIIALISYCFALAPLFALSKEAFFNFRREWSSK